MSSRAAEYREMIDGIVDQAHLLEPEERMELHDLLARIERRMLAKMPGHPTDAYQGVE